MRGRSTALVTVAVVIGLAPTGLGAAEVEPGLAERIAAEGTGSYLVLLDGRAELDDLGRVSDRETRGRLAYERLRASARAAQAGVVELLGERRAADVVAFRAHFAVNAVSVTSGVATLELLGQRPEVARVVSARAVPLAIGPAAAAGGPEAVEWAVSRVGAPAMWALGHDGSGVVVATLDTGVRFTHDAVVGSYRGNLGGGTYDHDFAWYDPAGACPTAEPCDNVDLGTALVSAMVGDDGGANQVGVAPGATWITAKGCESASCSDANLLAAADWLLAPCPVGDQPGAWSCDPTRRPDVVVVAWDSGAADPWFEDAVDAWEAAGIVTIAKAGNSGPTAGSVASPAEYCNVVAVGAVDSSDTVPGFSARGPGHFACSAKPDLVAPGSGVRLASSSSDSAYSTRNGTSYAATFAGGCAALLLSAAPQLDREEVAALLAEGADDLGATGFDHDSGHGVVRADQALSRLADLVLVDGFESGGTRAWSNRVPAAGSLFLLDGGGSSVALGGRAGADAMCAAALASYPGLPTANVRAFLSVDATDEIRDMPFLYGMPTDRRVVSPTGVAVADDWSDLLDGSIDESLLAAGVLTSAPYWYSGSTVLGTLVPPNCSGWTNDGAIADGRYGDRLRVDAGWIARGNATCGLSSYHVLCLAWE